ncbi:MAG: calcium/proton exchanger [Acidobacteria bacterium]|nr:calcium/proton exchanger [Acidobacteriota bacterium]MBI3426095.1 calcium/proton exchanger [Acidobacteriota bacterium]
MLKNLLAVENLLNLLLVFVPIAAVLELTHANPIAIFATAALAIIPLAGLMGRATEHLAEKLGEGVGGLLNATFGNAAELIIALMALRAGLFDVVKASVTGSIIGNLLLVLGLSILAGGLRFPQQKFNTTAAQLGSTMMALSAIGLMLPAVFHLIVRNNVLAKEQNLSLEIAIVLFITYVLSLVFSLKTHSHLYVGELQDEEEQAIGTHGWSQRRSVVTLLLATVLVAVMSEFLVGAVEAASKSLGLTEIFVGVILVAIIGNAAEHSTAVLMALKNKMDLALNIAIGSSMQVALFVAPVLIFASYAFGRPMNLHFTALEVVAIAASVAVLALIVQDGESNWMEGVLLLAVYIILGLTFYFLPAAGAGALSVGASTAAPVPSH